MNIAKEIAQFLTTLPNIGNPAARRALMYQAGLDERLINQLDFEGDAYSFCHNAIAKLVKYGKLENGRDALDVVLQAAQAGVGRDKQAECEQLRQRWRDAHTAPVPPLPKKSRRIALIGLVALFLFAIAGGAHLFWKDRLTTAAISGRVSDETTLTPLSGVRVSGEGFQEVMTGADGKFEVSVPEKHQRATYRLTFSRAGYASKSILKRPAETFEVRLKPIGKD